MTVCFLRRELLFHARIAEATEPARVAIQRVDSLGQLPRAADVSLFVVDWSNRPRQDHPYGPHTDLEVHAAARDTDLGPLWARSQLAAEA